MAHVQLDQDKSYHKILDGDAFPDNDQVVFKELRSDLLLVVDTSTWYVYYKESNTWYAQL